MADKQTVTTRWDPRLKRMVTETKGAEGIGEPKGYRDPREGGPSPLAAAAARNKPKPDMDEADEQAEAIAAGSKRPKKKKEPVY